MPIDGEGYRSGDTLRTPSTCTRCLLVPPTVMTALATVVNACSGIVLAPNPRVKMRPNFDRWVRTGRTGGALRERALGRSRQELRWPKLHAEFVQQTIDEEWDIFRALAEGRRLNHNRAEPVVKIAAEVRSATRRSRSTSVDVMTRTSTE